MSYNMYAIFGLNTFDNIGEEMKEKEIQNNCQTKCEGIDFEKNFQFGQIFVAKYKTVIDYQYY